MLFFSAFCFSAPPNFRAVLLRERIHSPAPDLEWLCDEGADRTDILLQLWVEPNAPKCDCGGLQQSGELH